MSDQLLKSTVVKGKAEGKAEGILYALLQLVRDGLLDISVGIERSGVSETEFNPEGQVKREEFVKMINTLYNGQEITAQFTDMDMTAWYVLFVPLIHKADNT